MIDPIDLHAYADQALDASEMARVEAAIRQDPALQSQLLAIQDLKKALQSHCTPVEDPAAWSACRDRIRALDQTHRAESFVSRYSRVFAGGLAALILGVGLMNRMAGPTGSPMSVDDVPRMVAGMAPTNPTDGSQSWIRTQSKQDITDRRLPLMFGQAYSGTVEGRQICAVDVTDGTEIMRLYVLPGTESLEGLQSSFDNRYQVGTLNGLNSVAWKSGDQTLLLMGQRTSIQLQRVAEEMRER